MSTSNLKATTVYIQDVEYTGEDITMNENSPYNNVIILLLKEAQTGNLYVSVLTPADVAALGKSEGEVSPKIMKFFADKLAQRKQPMRVVVNPEEEQITPELLNMSEEELIMLQQNDEMLNDNAKDILNRFKFRNMGEGN